MSDLQVILVCPLNQLHSCIVSFSALVASSYCRAPPPPSIPCHLPGLQAWPTYGVSGNISASTWLLCLGYLSQVVGGEGRGKWEVPNCIRFLTLASLA